MVEMVEVELVGGEFDGLRSEMAAGPGAIVVPLAFWHREDGSGPVLVESLEYASLGRSGREGIRCMGSSGSGWRGCPGRATSRDDRGAGIRPARPGQDAPRTLAPGEGERASG